MTRTAGQLLLAAIGLVTLLAFLPSIGNIFVDWDDNLNFTDNPHYRGLGWSQLRWMFGATVTGHYIPVTWMTLGFDYLLWGMNPVGYHLTNVVLHALSAVIVALIALRLLRQAAPGCDTRALWAGAAATALFFALHPLRVETVAWVTERRGLLSGFFALLTVLTYLRMCAATDGTRRRWFATSVGCYALALASKAAAIPLPVVLLVLDVYPLRRLGAPRRVLIEKLPYVLLAAAAAVIAAAVVQARGVFASVESYPPGARGAMLAYSLAFYVRKTVVPLDLSPLYELPAHVSSRDPSFLASIVAVLVATAALWILRRRWPAGLACWAAYAVMLVPVSGLFQAGRQLVADRYSYLSCLPWALLIGAAVCATLDAATAGRLQTSAARGAAVGVTVWIAGLTALTSLQIPIWRDTETLWRYAVEIDPACSLCHNQLGAEFGNRGELGPAIDHFQRALLLRPGGVGMHGQLGLALLKTGRFAEAIPHLTRVLERYPANVDTRVRLGEALAAVGRLDDATEQLRQAVQLDPGHAGARYALARAYRARGDRAAAGAQTDALRRLDPGLARRLE